MDNIEVCQHCGQELKMASKERKEISETQLDNIAQVGEALEVRHVKVDAAADELLAIVQRIEKSLGADLETKQAVKELEAKIRARIVVEGKRETLVQATILGEGKNEQDN